MICPISLLSADNGTYYWNAEDCSSTSGVTMTSDHPLQCGCDPTNPDCQSHVFDPGTGGGGFGPMSPIGRAPSMLVARMSPGADKPRRKSAPKAKVKDKYLGDHQHLVHIGVATRGLKALLPADHEWQFSRATIDPAFEGENAYHVVKIDGRDRYIRVIRATIKPPPNLYHLRFIGKVPRLDPLCEVELRIGQETELPRGVKPKPMLIAAPDRSGPCYHQLTRSGPKVDPAVFHVLLKK